MNKLDGNFMDKNGVNINIDDDVLVPSPNKTDIHKNAFVGFITEILENGNAIVSDEECNLFEIESNRLEVITNATDFINTDCIDDDTISLEEKLFPGSGKLVDTNGELSATIVDAELDPFECSFQADGCVDIKPNRMKYIKLSINNLYRLIALIEESEEIYNNQPDEEEK